MKINYKCFLKNKKSTLSTVLGLLATCATAMAVLNFDTFSFKNINDLVKLFIVLLPAINGYITEIKTRINE